MGYDVPFGNILFPALVLTATYGLVIWGLVAILRLRRVSPKRAIVLGFLVFGITTGLLVVWDWPLDRITYYNLFTVLLGNEVYQLSITVLGDPHSDQAHYTIPWFLRIPQVYLIVSAIFWGLLGLILQAAVNKQRTPSTRSPR
jgi:hypothetical protein